eukprot:SAG22_NODE_371_length_11566_cov_5.447458_2_plen_127_part_00
MAAAPPPSVPQAAYSRASRRLSHAARCVCPLTAGGVTPATRTTAPAAAAAAAATMAATAKTVSAVDGLAGLKVCIVGAGMNGLVAARECLDKGLRPTCFEREDGLGGLWRFTEHESHSSVSTRTSL